jgi:glycosyltransferase involved in cell wall biosynthesis
MGSSLRYVPLPANGVLSTLYDVISLMDAMIRGVDVVLVLGVSGGIFIPCVRRLSRARVVVNVDGIEWRRDKWGRLARWFLRRSEEIAVRYADAVVADNEGIRDHLMQAYKRDCPIIAYGGDHAVSVPRSEYTGGGMPRSYALSICRIEPENNVEMILRAFSSAACVPLVFIGNWSASEFGRRMRDQYGQSPHVVLLDPIYDAEVLRGIREDALLYVHGHSAGGTNPSLVEMLFFSVPIAAFDCEFNRFSLEGGGRYFDSAESLTCIVREFNRDEEKTAGQKLLELGRRRYTWAAVSREYFDLFATVAPRNR